ncbi:hypothetical protein B0H14DRAFT_3524106 [Mycena olivaceomarginata]|nr:hypothetical protein B0H14DRAFT_3524106 [Mycena olivaceomarginata]
MGPETLTHSNQTPAVNTRLPPHSVLHHPPTPLITTPPHSSVPALFPALPALPDRFRHSFFLHTPPTPSYALNRRVLGTPPLHATRRVVLLATTALCRQSAYSDRTVHISAHRIYTGPSRLRPYALYDISVPHPARCAPSRSLHPHPGVTDSVLAHALDTVLCIGYNSHLHLHAQCTLPPHHSPPRLSPSLHHPRPLYDAHDYGHRQTPRSPHSCSLRRHTDICMARPPYFHMSLTTFLSPLSPSIILAAPYSRTRPVAAQRPQRSNTRPTTHPRTRACCCMAALRLRAPHRAADPVQLAPTSTCQYALQPRPHYSAIPASPTEKQWKDEERNADVQR